MSALRPQHQRAWPPSVTLRGRGVRGQEAEAQAEISPTWVRTSLREEDPGSGLGPGGLLRLAVVCLGGTPSLAARRRCAPNHTLVVEPGALCPRGRGGAGVMSTFLPVSWG